MKSYFLIILIIALCGCSNPVNEELLRTGKSSAAQGRIGASQSGASSVFKDFD